MLVSAHLKEGRPSEGGHWYNSETGGACYEIRGKNGLMRPVNLRDAREWKLVPGVSSILAMEAKPMLERWKIRQAIMSALTLPRVPGETEDEFSVRAEEDSKEQARKAAARGTQIHAALQGAFEGKPVTAEDLPYVEPVRAWLAQRYGLEGWQAESSFACPMGYGGKADLIHHGIPAVADFKVKDFTEEKQAKELAWPEHAMQLAAYRNGFGLHKADCLNIFVSSRVPGLICVREWDEDEISENWDAFCALLLLWKIRKRFNPAFSSTRAA